MVNLPLPPTTLTSVTPADPRYRSVSSTYMRVGSPAVVIQPGHDDDVAQALAYAADIRNHVDPTIALSVRSGGHGISGSGTNDGGIVIDLSRLKRIDVDGTTVTADAGVTWGDMARVLAPYDLTITSGNVGGTGVGGLATAGGLGYFARSQGLTIDRVRRVKLAKADGTITWVDETHEPDLFWAVRGGATHVGIALEVVFEATDMHTAAGTATIINQGVQYLTENVGAFTQRWGEWIEDAPHEMESFLMLQDAGGGKTVVQARNIWSGDDKGAATPTLEAALQLDRVLDSQAFLTSYPDIVPGGHTAHYGQQRIKMRDVLVDQANENVGEAIRETLSHPLTVLAELRALGGAVSDVPADATAWAGRHQRALAGTWLQPAAPHDLDASFAPLLALGTGMYGAYTSDTSPKAAELSWPGETGTRLLALSEQADPTGLFTNGLSLRN